MGQLKHRVTSANPSADRPRRCEACGIGQTGIRRITSFVRQEAILRRIREQRQRRDAEEEAEEKERREAAAAAAVFGEDDDDLEPTNFETIDYIEHVETGEVYNLKGEKVGDWNDDVDDIIWINQKFREIHETARP